MSVRRWALNILAGVSLLVFIVGVGLWVRGIWGGDFVSGIRHGAGAGVASLHGRVFVVWSKGRLMDMPFQYQRIDPADGVDLHEFALLSNSIHALNWSLPGVTYRGARNAEMAIGTASVSYAWIEGFSAVLPILWAVRWRRLRGRLVEKVCRSCAYDLRASKGRCPECGTEIEAGKETKGSSDVIAGHGL